MEILPDDNCFMCALDGDAMFLDNFFGRHLSQVINTHTECGCFVAMTNRIGCLWQRQQEVEWKSDDIRVHRRKSQELWKHYEANVVDVSNVDRGQVLGGVVILLKKSVWKKIGGFKEKGILGVDNDLHWKCMDNNELVYLMSGIYVYHWYRGGNASRKEHLL